MVAAVKLVASMLTHNEMGRYIDLVAPALLEFCDEICVLDDGSTDGTDDWLLNLDHRQVGVANNPSSEFFGHEGKTRQKLYEWTLAAEPTHILAIDADEFIGDGSAIREAIDLYPDTAVWSIGLDEIWQAEQDCLCVRIDGAWGHRRVPLLYRTPPEAAGWRIQDRALACGREPIEVLSAARAAGWIDTEVLHFGWTRESERIARHARYVEHDNGQFHARRHLDSILWDSSQVRLEASEWPPSVLPYRAEILDRVST